MYIEFIIIYILILISIAIGVINLILNLGKKSENKLPTHNDKTQPVPMVQSNKLPTEQPLNNSSLNQGVAFCTKCAHQFPGNEKFCPYCGTPRQ